MKSTKRSRQIISRILGQVSKGEEYQMGIKSKILISLLKLGKAKQKNDHKKNKAINIFQVRKDVTVVNTVVGFLQPPRKDIKIDHDQLGDIKSWHIKGGEGSKRVILYFHGGGYFFSLKDLSNFFKYFLPELAVSCDAEVWAPDYRTAPDHPYPAAIEDAYQAYLSLLHKGVDPKNIYVMGDSAGGGLSLALLLKLRDERIKLPKASVVMSPWTDLALTGDSLKTKAHLEPMFYAGRTAAGVALSVSEDRVREPYISPLYGDYTGIPPLLIIVGGQEILYDDSTRIAEKAKQAGVNVTLDINEDMIHTYPVFGGIFKEGKEALERIAKFVRKN